MQFHDKFRQLRKTFGYSQQQLAIKLSTDRTLISHWESGNRKPNSEMIAKISNVFGVSTDYLLGLTTVPDGEVITRLNVMTQKVKVYGKIPAGIPFEAIEDMLDDVYVPDKIARKKDLFGLKIVGDSMSKIIPDGAIGVFEKTNHLENGEVGAIMVNGYDATVKKFYKLTDSVVLEPVSYNDEHRPLIIRDGEETVAIIGKLVWFCPSNDF